MAGKVHRIGEGLGRRMACGDGGKIEHRIGDHQPGSSALKRQYGAAKGKPVPLLTRGDCNRTRFFRDLTLREHIWRPGQIVINSFMFLPRKAPP